MWRARLTVVALLAVTAIAATTPPASAGGIDQPFIADLNEDGLPDRIRSGGSALGGCAVYVEAGRPGGGYLPAVEHRYLVRPDSENFYCPDLGTAADLRGDGVPEIILTWHDHRNADDGGNLLIVENFTLTHRFPGLVQYPATIEAADFNGDGKEDVWAYTIECDGFNSMLSDGAGGLLPSPTKWRGEGIFPIVTDFDANGLADVVLDYWDKPHCGDTGSGVVVLLGGGGVQHLERSPVDNPSEIEWAVELVQANRDTYPDIRTANAVTGRINHHLGNGNGFFIKAPKLVGDQAYLSRSNPQPAVIDITVNDWVTRDAPVKLTIPPQYGRVTLTADRKVTYTPNPIPPHLRLTDKFVYQVTEPNGEKAATSVYVRWRN